MRRTFNNIGFIKDYDRMYASDGLCGVSLGFDFCAEHEWGMRELTQLLGIDLNDTNKIGIDRFKVKNGKEVCLVENDLGEVFMFSSNIGSWRYLDATADVKLENVLGPKCYLNSELLSLRRRAKEDGQALVAAWDKKSFLVMVSGKEYGDNLKKIHQMFLDGKMTCKSLDVEGFRSGGLVFVNIDSFTKDELDEFGAEDESKQRLAKAVHKTGIEDRLKETGCRYFALSPKWNNDEETEIIFWLNPAEQRIHNCGWFTLADLEDWIDNKGKIIMTDEQRKERA
jgi:hypothetical protein